MFIYKFLCLCMCWCLWMPLFLCICVYLCLCLNVCMCASVSVCECHCFLCMCVFMLVFIHMSLCWCLCMWLWMSLLFVCIYVLVSVFEWTSLCWCPYTYVGEVWSEHHSQNLVLSVSNEDTMYNTLVIKYSEEWWCFYLLLYHFTRLTLFLLFNFVLFVGEKEEWSWCRRFFFCFLRTDTHQA